MVITEGSTEDGLTKTSEIVCVIGGVVVRMNAVGPDVFDGTQLDM